MYTYPAQSGGNDIGPYPTPFGLRPAVIKELERLAGESI
jgi:hypothetical protein